MRFHLSSTLTGCLSYVVILTPDPPIFCPTHFLAISSLISFLILEIVPAPPYTMAV